MTRGGHEVSAAGDEASLSEHDDRMSHRAAAGGGRARALPIKCDPRRIQDLQRHRRARSCRSRCGERRVPDAARPLGLGQDDAADGDGGFRARRTRANLRFGETGSFACPAPARRRRGVPELCAVPSPHCRREHCFPIEACVAWDGAKSRGGWSRRLRWCSFRILAGGASRALSGGQRQRMALARAIVFGRGCC